MSVNHIFRQLTAGISFNTKSFAGDAKRFGLAKTKESEGVADEATAAAAQLPSLEAVREEVRAELKRKRKLEEESEDDENDITLLGKHVDVVVTISRIIRRAENKLYRQSG
jgi:hypothetical protein